ncbi:MAG TPA: type II toxin-antitoxin system RelE/ParE family toxin [Mesorhizobium sp.]|nr:type II toxin-antitoxin system RelE/ParE family toxin [Mesorhizobium sp.]
MMEVRRTPQFAQWLRQLRDREARIRIASRIERLAEGNPGDVRPVGEGISELRVNHGPGYRVYYAQRRNVTILLLLGGNKSTQATDIQKAKELAREWREGDP